MLYLIWFFLVGSILIMIMDMMLEEWAGMDVIEGGAWLIRRFSKGKAHQVKAEAPVKSSISRSRKKT